jgi:glutamate--cysteine ligase catalytic subunit
MRNCFPPPPLPENGVTHDRPVDEEYEEMTMDEIMNGKVISKCFTLNSQSHFGQLDAFPGLLSLIYAYLDTLDVDDEALAKIEKYLDLIRRRANGMLSRAFVAVLFVYCLLPPPFLNKGSLKTPASWIRDFVRSHPGYKYDSVVSQEINYDLLVAVDQM